MQAPTTLTALFEAQAQRYAHKCVVASKKNGIYHPVSYPHFWEDVLHVAASLYRIGMRGNHHIAIWSHNCPEWAMMDFAVLSLGAADVPIYPTMSEAEIAYIINDSESTMLAVETTEQLQTVNALAGECPTLKGIILFHESPDVPDCPLPIYRFRQLRTEGKHESPHVRDAVRQALSAVTPDTLASIVYTSGTTGSPKGVMLTHGNFMSNVRDLLAITPLSDADSLVSFLPLSHVFERTVGYYTAIGCGASIYYAESQEKLVENLQEVRPTILICVPRLFEKIRQRLLENLSPFQKPIFDWAQRVGVAYQNALKNEKTPPFWLRFQFRIADRLAFKKVQSRTGGRIRFFVSGGAALSKELAEFFHAMGLLVIEGYGMTESAPVIACNRLKSYRFGTVGKALPSVSVKVADDGELLARGPNIMQGYYHRDRQTQIAIDPDGWLHTGDIAEMDSEGFIRIIDRKKEIIVLSNGKKVAPLVVEETYKNSPYIAQVDVIGEKRNYITALIVPQMDWVQRYLRRKGITVSAPEKMVRDPAVIRLFTDLLKKEGTPLAEFEKIKKFVLLPAEFSIEDGLLTPTLKLKRKQISERYEPEIESMYTTEEPHSADREVITERKNQKEPHGGDREGFPERRNQKEPHGGDREAIAERRNQKEAP